MNVGHPDGAIAPIASAIGEPARARMLFTLIDGRARTATELAVLAGITPSTASVHLQRLTTLRLVKVFAQGKHRYFSLDRPEVAPALGWITAPDAESACDVTPRGAAKLTALGVDAAAARGTRRRFAFACVDWS